MIELKVRENVMIEPIRCGCGGEAKVFFPFANNSVYMIECKKCGICTSAYDTEAEAITVWNRAMGKRSAKVTDTWKIAGFDELNAWCPECKHRITQGCSYCPTCGVRLEWR